MKYCKLITTGLLFIASLASAASLTNADIIKMSGAKLDEAIIITAIAHSEAAFDTSAMGLIELSKASVPQSIIEAMIKKGDKSDATAAPAKSAAKASAMAETDSDMMAPSDVKFVDGDDVHTMRYLVPQVRTAARALGLGGVASYAVLRGTAASERTHNKRPSFLVLVPDQAQVESYLTVASFAVRKNNSREVMVGGGYMSYSTGIHPDRVMPVTSQVAADQAKAPKGFKVYEVTPSVDLVPGEYAVILYTGEMQALVGAYFTGGGNSYFDFGVDP